MMNEITSPPELGIPEANWKQTPASVKAVILALYPLLEEVKSLKKEVAKLQEQLNLNSSNSSKPPSSDGPKQKIVKGKPKEEGKKRGGQKGHEGHRRELRQ